MVEKRKKPAKKVEYATKNYVREMLDLTAPRVDGLWKSFEAWFERKLFATHLMLAVVGTAVLVIAGIMLFGGR